MKATRLRLRLLGFAMVVCLPTASWASDTAPIADPDRDRAYDILDAAKSKVAGNVRKQADALVAHAWPTGGGDGDPMVASIAREQLTRYGNEGLQALRQALQQVDPQHQFDVIAAVMETRANISGGMPTEYLPTVDDAIWFGSLEAKRIAIPEAARNRYPLALLTIMDAAYEHPQLVPLAAQAMGDFRNHRAIRFLKEIMLSGHPYERRLAARALGRIGSRGMAALREAARDDDAGCRSAALETLLPVTSVDDLSLLHEYIGLHRDEDPPLHDMATRRALLLETIQERQMESDAASAD